MVETIKISIIVPVYNVEKYLDRCIGSIKNQEYTFWEAILVDDGSKDSSGVLCDNVAKNDSRFRVFHKDNEGLGLTRNFGIMHATGDYLFFLDSDDYIEPNALSELVKWVNEYKCDVAVGNFFYQDKKVEISIESKLYKGPEVKECIVNRILGNLPGTNDQLTPSSCGNLYRKDIFDKTNILFPSERKLIWEDLAFNYDYMLECDSVYLDDVPIYHYCYNDGSLTHSYDSEKLNKVMIMYQFMKEKIGNTDEEIIRLNNNFIGHIRTCFKLEAYYDKQNGYKKTVKNIKNMCNDNRVLEIINNFDFCYYNTSQKIFSFLLKHQKALLVYLLCKAQNIKKRID